MNTKEMFERIILEKEQKELLCWMVDNIRNIPRNKRSKFIAVTHSGGCTLLCAGIPNRMVCLADLEALADVGILRKGYNSKGSPTFDITPYGYEYYGYLRTCEEKPFKEIEKFVFEYLMHEEFMSKYPSAYDKWNKACTLLWDSESLDQLSTVGHLCRESVQEFVATLIENIKLDNVDSNRAHTKNRLKAVLDYKSSEMGETEKPFITVIVDYWDKVIDLVQRQEHESTRERKELTWEDGRRVIFHTAIIMFEIDRIMRR